MTRWIVALLVLLCAAEAHAYAVRVSCANKNVTDADGWCTVDNVSTTGSSFSDSEAANTELSTSYTCSAAFQWAVTAPVVDAVAVKVANRAASPSTYTFTVCLNSSATGANCGAGDNTGREATLLASDLENLQALNQGWVMVKLAASMTPSTATNYYVCAKESNAGADVNLYRTSTASDWSRMLRTTTTGAPAAGDQLHVIGDWPSDTQTAYTMTINTNDTNSYGQLTATLPQGITVGKGGTLTYSSAVSTTSQLKFKGVMAVFSGGTFNVGNCTNRDYSGGCSTFIPSTSTATLTFDSSGTNVDAGLSVFSGGMVNIYGSNSPSIVKDLLAADVANGATTITTTQTTGWLSGDEIVISSTSQTPGDAEMKALTGNCAGTSCAITALTTANTTSMCNTAGNYNHCGVAPTQADLGRLTRNVKLNGTDSSHQGYILVQAGAQFVARYAEFKWMGSATANKRGIDVQTTTCATTPCFDLQYSSVHDFTVASSLGVNVTGSLWDNVTISNNVFWNNINISFITAATSGTAATVSNNLLVGTGGTNTSVVALGDVATIFTGNIVTSGSGASLAIQVFEAAPATYASGNFANNSIHASASAANNTGALYWVVRGVAQNTTIWRNAGPALAIGNVAAVIGGVEIDGLVAFGNGTSSIVVGDAGNVVIKGLVSNGDAKYATTSAINVAANTNGTAIRVLSPTLDVAAGSGGNARVAHTNDVNVASGHSVAEFVLENPTLSATNPVGSQTNLSPGSYVAFQRFNGTVGDHRRYVREGTIQTTSADYYTAAPAEKLTPNANAVAATRLESGGIGGEKCVAVNASSTVTPSVRVCLSAAYNGLAPRLIRKRNQALYGATDTADQVLATGALTLGTCAGTGGTGWQQLTGETSPITQDAGVVCFSVDVTGTAGYAVVDDWASN